MGSFEEGSRKDREKLDRQKNSLFISSTVKFHFDPVEFLPCLLVSEAPMTGACGVRVAPKAITFPTNIRHMHKSSFRRFRTASCRLPADPWQCKAASASLC